MDWINNVEEVKETCPEAWDDFFSDLDESEREDRFNETYQGSYESKEECAQQIAEDLFIDSEEMGKWPYYHIDWEAAANDLEHDYNFYAIESLSLVYKQKITVGYHVFRIV